MRNEGKVETDEKESDITEKDKIATTMARGGGGGGNLKKA
jgi:hypothetical protein